MSSPQAEEQTTPLVVPEWAIPDLSKLITQDDTPVDSIFAEKEQRLLTHPLYCSWPGPGEGKPFLALSNAGYFYNYLKPPLVPDMMLGIDVEKAGPLSSKEGHSYYQWLMEYPPAVVIEIVSDRRGGEETYKFRQYARAGVFYYAIHDPLNILEHGALRVYANQRGHFEPIAPAPLPDLGLGLTLWTGVFEREEATWLRWCDADGRLILTGEEKVALVEQQAEQERQRADQERQRADEVQERMARLEAALRSRGIDPGQLQP
jgi:hypothetical protein